MNIKSVISPLQKWLLSQGRCVGCGKPLAKNPHKKHPKGEIVQCSCRRIYIKEKSSYRRALQSEAK